MKHIHMTIPVWNLTQYQPTQRILIAVVESYSANGRKCFMTNRALSELLHCDARTVRRWIAQLTADGQISAAYHGSRRYLSRHGHECPEGRTQMSGVDGHACPGGADTAVHHTIKETINDITNQTELTDMKERPSINDVTDYLITTPRAQESGLSRAEIKRIALDCVEHYDANDWTTRSGDRISSWKSAASAWMRRSLKDYTPRPVERRPQKTDDELRREIQWHSRRLINYRDTGRLHLAQGEAASIRQLRAQMKGQ